MNRITYLAAAGALVASSGLGAWAADAATGDSPTAHVRTTARHGADDGARHHRHHTADHAARHQRHGEPGDDHGGANETGDDHGGGSGSDDSGSDD